MVGLFNTPHMNTRRKTHLESLFLVTMNHAGRPVRTHAQHTHTLNTCVRLCQEMHRQAFWKTHTTLFFRDATTHTDTHAHISFKISSAHSSRAHTHTSTHAYTHTNTSLFAMLECTGRPVRKNSHTHTTHTHTHTHTFRGRFLRDAESAQEGLFLFSNRHM